MHGNAYIAMTRGSPCVVPSCERMYSPPMNSLALPRYMFVSTGARIGHRIWTFFKAACLLRELKAFDASTSNTASGKGWFSNTSFTTGLKTLPTFQPDALVFFRAKI